MCMKQLALNTAIYKYDNCETFCREFRIGKDDLIITNKKIYDNYLKFNTREAAVLFKENYGSRGASEDIVEAMYEHVKRITYERVIAIGGGSILDIGKLFALKYISPIKDLYERKLEIIKEKELILVPTTCGTGSEVTNISSLEFKARNTKQYIVTDELYADSAVMIPELLKTLTFEVFINSSIYAFINAIESYLSPKATTYTKIFSMKAMEIILKGYKKIIEEGEGVRNTLLEEFLLASNYSGIAFGNSGGVMVNEGDYLRGGSNILDLEANYVVFTEIFEKYKKINQGEKIKELNKFLADLFECSEISVWRNIEEFLNNLTIKIF